MNMANAITKRSQLWKKISRQFQPKYDGRLFLVLTNGDIIILQTTKKEETPKFHLGTSLYGNTNSLWVDGWVQAW